MFMISQNEYLILLFHSIDERDVLSLRDLGNIRPEVFEKTVVALKKEFDIISLEDAVRYISGEGRGPARPLAITFDDGAMSYASRAVPVMETYGIPSTCFLITDCVDDRAIYWRYLYNYCVNAGRAGELERLIEAEYGVPAVEGGIIQFTRNNFSRKKTELIVERILERMISAEEYREREGTVFLSLEDIERMKENPLVTFGIHTRSHPVMLGLTDEEIRGEISGSLDFYGRCIGGDVPMFSVPFGRLYRDYDERTVGIARELSVPFILSAYGGGNAAGQPPFNIRRVPVDSRMLESGTEYLLRIIREASVPQEYIRREKKLEEKIGSSRAPGNVRKPAGGASGNKT